MFASISEALKFIRERDVRMVDLKVTGIAGQWLHITIPARQFNERHFADGVGYDGSSGSGFAALESGDVVALPEPQTAFLDPFFAQPTLSFLCGTVTADTREPFANDPRTIARRAVKYMQAEGIADEALMAPEFEFHVLDRVNVQAGPYHTLIDLRAAEVETDGAHPPISAKGGYLRVPPADRLHDLRTDVALILEQMGIAVRYHHHEVGAPGQCEIEIDLGELVRIADHSMLIKYVIKNVAARHGKIATFMPKPIYGEAGNGMHVHQKLNKAGKPLFFDERRRNYADLSDLALHYTAGLLTHGRALTGLTNPSTNSFKRLVEGYEAPVQLFFSLANRSAAIRVPRYASSPQEKRIEYRPPDFTGNLYLTLAAMLMAGLDGIRRQLDPGVLHFGPFDVDISRQSPSFLEQITPLPANLSDALTALELDHDFLTAGDVFPAAFVREWIATRRRRHVREIAQRPHPHEYELYLDT